MYVLEYLVGWLIQNIVKSDSDSFGTDSSMEEESEMQGVGQSDGDLEFNSDLEEIKEPHDQNGTKVFSQVKPNTYQRPGVVS